MKVMRKAEWAENRREEILKEVEKKVNKREISN